MVLDKVTFHLKEFKNFTDKTSNPVKNKTNSSYS